ncbi:hypothetical protein Hypma_001357 [Hypsizygus marmoreus]|uniref:Uncharacterized protein n=1 Tax=Hypsizygus marmoreus TaxID=39966 RepID=A0A369K3N5_HYPMA|nr:hypothetical protein Hypma_001357 [Hypsizygus marmoreus]
MQAAHIPFQDSQAIPANDQLSFITTEDKASSSRLHTGNRWMREGRRARGSTMRGPGSSAGAYRAHCTAAAPAGHRRGKGSSARMKGTETRAFCAQRTCRTMSWPRAPYYIDLPT